MDGHMGVYPASNYGLVYPALLRAVPDGGAEGKLRVTVVLNVHNPCHARESPGRVLLADVQLEGRVISNSGHVYQVRGYIDGRALRESPRGAPGNGSQPG